MVGTKHSGVQSLCRVRGGGCILQYLHQVCHRAAKHSMPKGYQCSDQVLMEDGGPRNCSLILFVLGRCYIYAFVQASNGVFFFNVDAPTIELTIKRYRPPTWIF